MLKDLVVSADPDTAELLLVVDLASCGRRSLNDIVDGAEGDVEVEAVAKDLKNAPERAVAEQQQSDHELMQPVFGDRQVKEHLVVVWAGVEGGVERLSNDGLLLVNELTTDLNLLSQVGDG